MTDKDHIEKSARLITRSEEPLVKEFPFANLSACITNELFFIRNHFPTPHLEETSWRLNIEGLVENPTSFSLADLRSMPSRSIQVLLECAGNNRTFLNPPVKGVQWDLGGVSSANWKGVSLNTVLQKAGIRTAAIEVIFEGADCGEVDDELSPAGKINFMRSLPLEKALSDDVILAYEMNGQPLSPDHGFPLRLIVPGWYAVASVKWLNRIVVSDEQFRGYFQSIDYAFWDKRNGYPVRTPITTMQVKALISSPQSGQSIKTGTTHFIQGAAWSGTGKIEKVELSTNAGKTWDEATLEGERNPSSWTLWQYQWKVPESKGEYVLMARATDENGNTQPDCHDPDRETYMINFCFPVEVQVVA